MTSRQHVAYKKVAGYVYSSFSVTHAITKRPTVTMPLKILIIGAGVCGPAVTYLLLRTNPDHEITVIERSLSLRSTGQQIDLRAQGIPLMKKIGLLDAVRERVVHERGVEFLGRNGKRKALVTMNDTGKGRQSFTSEYEIMRGDLVDILYEASIKESNKAKGTGSIKYEFGKTTDSISQDEKGVDITFSDGSKHRYDIVIGADGQNSRTRKEMFGKEVSASAYKELGVCTAFYSIPPLSNESVYAQGYHTPGRLVITRPSKPDITAVYLMTTNQTSELNAVVGQPVEKQKEAWAKAFADLGWQDGRLLSGMKNTSDFYSSTIGQVKLEHFVKGRIALLGDAGYVPSPVTGMGTTCSLVGAYVLAGELTKHKDDVPSALKAYEEVMRPFVVEAQKLVPGFPSLMVPKTNLGITILHLVLWFVTIFKIDKLIGRILPEENGGWAPPDYPGLKFDS